MWSQTKTMQAETFDLNKLPVNNTHIVSNHVTLSHNSNNTPQTNIENMDTGRHDIKHKGLKNSK